ncbi:serine/arginine repetitive matrix protein 3-like [Coturnix japonica]|uniref:serine/arginine repetitive matrix protein 3-like n=1 Tax=Coturnix japonica TaxID=93934 RepID=UPI0007776245|nr:serine/arginine repetitive matrix protein 3-like [Coturnix japonica]
MVLAAAAEARTERGAEPPPRRSEGASAAPCPPARPTQARAVSLGGGRTRGSRTLIPPRERGEEEGGGGEENVRPPLCPRPLPPEGGSGSALCRPGSGRGWRKPEPPVGRTGERRCAAIGLRRAGRHFGCRVASLREGLGLMSEEPTSECAYREHKYLRKRYHLKCKSE